MSRVSHLLSLRGYEVAVAISAWDCFVADAPRNDIEVEKLRNL